MSRPLQGLAFGRVANSEEFIRSYQAIRADYQALKPFASPQSVRACLEDRDPACHAIKDAVLEALIREYQLRPRPLLSEFLAALFLPGIASICRRFLHRADLEPAADVGNQAWLSFFEGLKAYDFKRHPGRIAGCLMGMTRNRLRDWLRQRHRELRCRKHLEAAALHMVNRSGTRIAKGGRPVPLGPGGASCFWGVTEDLLRPGREAGDPETMRLARQLLSGLAARGLLREPERHVLLATTLASISLSTAAGRGEYQKLKKTRQRAQARLRRLWREQPDLIERILHSNAGVFSVSDVPV